MLYHLFEFSNKNLLIYQKEFFITRYFPYTILSLTIYLNTENEVIHSPQMVLIL